MSNENTQPVELSAEQTDEASGGILPAVAAAGAAAVWIISNYSEIRDGIVDGIWDANHPA
jgi:hypothetical protein